MAVNFKLTSACVIGGAMTLATSVQALTSAPPANTSTDDNSNPYAVIMDRNVFRLNPIPPPPPPVEQKPKDLPKVYLSGIVKVGDDLRVLFSTPAKDKTPATYFKLAVGEKDGELELVKVHPDEQKVDVIVAGTPMTLSMLTDTLLTATGSKSSGEAPAPGPGRPGFGRLRQGNALQPTPPPAPAAAAVSRESSAVIVGGERDSSAYGGGTMVAGGGGGVTTIGGGNSGSSFGGGTMIGGGGGGGSSFGGGTTVSGGTGVGGGTTVGANGTVGAQIANALSSPSGPSQVANVPTGTVMDPEQQALAMAAYAATHPDAPPLPPGVQAQVDGTTWSPPTHK